MEHKPRLEAFITTHQYTKLVPSAYNRDWMDKFNDRHAYRCLPLSIANVHGWDVLCPTPIEITWNGGLTVNDLVVRALEPMPNNMPLEHFARSNFSRGIVTMHTGYMFRTPPNWSLMATGPFNKVKVGIAPLTGIIETDWLPYPFTMNWQMTQPGTVRFEKDEPFCMVMPLPKNYLEEWDVVIHDLKDDPVLDAEQTAFRVARDEFMVKFRAKDPETIKQAWQKHYFVGRHPDGRMVENHTNKMRLADPQNMIGKRPLYAKDKTTEQTISNNVIPATQTSPQTATQTQQLPQFTMPSFMATATTLGCPFQHTPVQPITQKNPNWRDSSKLNTFNNEYNQENENAKANLKDGILTSTAKTRHIAPTTDPSTLDFVFAPEFLSKDECKLLCDTAIALADKQAMDVKDPYWKGRTLFFRVINAEAKEAAEVMRKANERTIKRLVDFYELTAPIYADLLQLVQWREGMFMPPHADGKKPDGTPHEFKHRAFGGIIYLNDDYEGGELYLTRSNTVIKPRAGTLLSFTGGFHHEHGVLKVHKGLRLTMPSFFTFDETKKDKTIYR